ncbi:MAG: hypothetical protein J6R22_03210 [Alphaproteobacteria bacterium]|nr:hypothetical protein [Alphaproteobacteria bacterium]
MADKANTEQVFKQIKKQNGEKFAQVIRGDRTHDGSLLEVPNIVHILEFAGRDEIDAIQIRRVIQEIYIEHKDDQYFTTKSPLELLSEAGYDAFVVKNEEQKNSIIKYYRPGEEICTFKDPQRHIKNYIIHAVKRGADKIQPSAMPRREDEYGTSVISIQIAKTGGYLSIKNRYNHTISDPDATFDNNPDNIIPGLTMALQRYFGVEFNATKTPLPEKYRMLHDQIVQYHYEIDNVYFGPNYYFSGSTITKLDSDCQIMMDYMIYDTRTKEISSPIDDDAVKVFKTAFNGQSVTRTTNKSDKTTVLSTPNGNRVTIKDGKIIELSLPHVKKIGNNFLRFNDSLRTMNLASVETIGENFLSANKILSQFRAPKLQRTEKDFLTTNKALKKLDLPELITMGQYSLGWNEGFESIRAPKATYLGHLPPFQPNLKEFYAPNLPEGKLEDFARNNSDVALAIAFQRVDKAMTTRFQEAQERLEKMIQEAAERMKKKYCEAYANVGLDCPEKE